MSSRCPFVKLLLPCEYAGRSVCLFVHDWQSGRNSGALGVFVDVLMLLSSLPINDYQTSRLRLRWRARDVLQTSNAQPDKMSCGALHPAPFYAESARPLQHTSNIKDGF
jgi:hypothetical protein